MTATAARPSVERRNVGREVLDEALGRNAPEEPDSSRWGGPAGNGRLTAWLGVLVLYLVVCQLLTLLELNKVLKWHVAIGAALIPFALAKTGVTGWRMVQYYRGVPVYRAAGPPPMVLRVLGPLVVLSTLGLVGTGLSLIAVGPTELDRPMFTLLGYQVAPLTLHQGMFILFAVFTGLHLLARLVPAWQRTVRAKEPVGGAGARAAVIGLTLIAAIVSSSILVHVYDHWF